jgi:sarcosine oxidase
MRIVVVGAGIIGLLTAVECVRAGAAVDIIDQGDIPSPQATSHDSHRVVRALHRGDARLTRSAARLTADWLEIEHRVGGQFYHPTGVLTAMAAPDVDAALALLAGIGITAQPVRQPELPARYPHVRFPAGTAAVLEPDAGTVLADRALQDLVGWLRAGPAVRVFPRRRVAAIGETGAVHLATGGAMSADHVVVAAGPWSRDLLPAAGRGDLVLWRQTMLSYAPGPAAGGWAGTPAVLGLGERRDAWLMPPVAGRPARLSAASACRPAAEPTDPGAPAEWRDHLVTRFAALLSGFDPAGVTGATDGYYLAAAGGGPALVGLAGGAATAYAACGGMSFKFAPTVARVLADLALGRPRRGPTGLDALDRAGLPAVGTTTT